MYVKLHQVFGGTSYLAKADELFQWLQDGSADPNNTTYGPYVDFGDGTAAWKLMIDPQGGDDTHNATGFEEGAAGIGMFLRDMYLATKDERYRQGAQMAMNWLIRTTVQTGNTISMQDAQQGGSSYVNDPSMHWGLAGLMMFAQRMANGKVDIPGEQSAIVIPSSR